MTTPAPKRREQRRTHLDASAVPVERALLARAAEVGSHLDVARRAARVQLIGAEVGVVRQVFRVAGIDNPRQVTALSEAVAVIVANEFRALAEELHWW